MESRKNESNPFYLVPLQEFQLKVEPETSVGFEIRHHPFSAYDNVSQKLTFPTP